MKRWPKFQTAVLTTIILLNAFIAGCGSDSDKSGLAGSDAGWIAECNKAKELHARRYVYSEILDLLHHATGNTGGDCTVAASKLSAMESVDLTAAPYPAANFSIFHNLKSLKFYCRIPFGQASHCTAAFLSAIPTLETLDYNSGLSDKDFDYFSERVLPKLRHLKISTGSRIDGYLSNSAVGKFAKMQQISNIEMTTSYITSDDCQAEESIWRLGSLPNLTSLVVTSNFIQHDLSALAKLKKLTRLKIFAADISSVSKISSLEYLDLRVNNASIEPIGNLRNLTFLSLDGSDIPTLDPIAKLKNLKTLHLNGMRHEGLVSQAALLSLGTLENLEELQISRVNYPTNVCLSSFDAFANFPKLKHLALAAQCFGPTLTIPENLLSRLEVLDLERNKLNDVNALLAAPNLYSLRIPENKISTEVVETLRKSRTWKIFNADRQRF